MFWFGRNQRFLNTTHSTVRAHHETHPPRFPGIVSAKLSWCWSGPWVVSTPGLGRGGVCFVLVRALEERRAEEKTSKKRSVDFLHPLISDVVTLSAVLGTWVPQTKNEAEAKNKNGMSINTSTWHPCGLLGAVARPGTTHQRRMLSGIVGCSCSGLMSVLASLP